MHALGLGSGSAAYYMAYDPASCEYIKLNDAKIDERLKRGPELVSSEKQWEAHLRHFDAAELDPTRRLAFAHGWPSITGR